MEQRHKSLLQFFADNKDNFFSSIDIPINIKSQFEVGGLELEDYLTELNSRRLIKSHPKKQLSYKIIADGLEYAKSLRKPLSEIDLMNKILFQLNTKDEGHCHYLEELMEKIGIDQNTLEVICMRIEKLGDCSYHPHCICITKEGKYKVQIGGYPNKSKQQQPHVTNNFHNSQIGNLNAGHVGGNLDQESDFSEKDLSHTVTTTPNIKESAANKTRWYNSTVFKYILYPIVVALLVWLITTFFTNKS